MENTNPIKPFRDCFDADLKKADLTQADIALALNVKQQAVSAWRSKNLVPLRRQIDLINVLRDVLGDNSEIVQAHQRMELNAIMGSEPLERYHRTRVAAWDRRKEYLDSTQSSLKHKYKNIDAKYLIPANKKPLENKALLASSLGSEPNKLFEFKATAETMKAHNQFLDALNLNFPKLETRRSLDHMNTQHQFDICIEDKIFIVSSGCFAKDLNNVRDFARYAIFALKLAAWANTLSDYTFIVVHGAHGASKSELLMLEQAAMHCEVLNLNMVIVDSYNDYFELIGTVYSNVKP